MGQITNQFSCAILFLLIFLPVQVHSQLNNFPYAQSFEGKFVLGDSVQFLPNWWANEVDENKRIFQDYSFSYTGAAALALQPTSSFQPRLRVYYNAQALQEALISFYAAHRKNGSGSRAVEVYYRFSADSGQSWTAAQLLDAEDAFPNEDGAYHRYELQAPESIKHASAAVFELQLSRGEGAGSTARLLLDEFLIEEGSSRFRLLSATALSAREIRVNFSQEIDGASLQPAHFSLTPAVGIASAARGNSPEQLVLSLSTDLQAGESYVLTAKEVVSASGQKLTEASTTFTYEPIPLFRSLVINEIFADPNPKGLWPELAVLPTDSRAEFVELLNRSDRDWPLENFSLNGKALGEGRISPGELLILCPSDFAQAYAAYGKVQAVSGWKTLTNAEGTLVLTYAGKVVDSVLYRAAWHHPDKKQGGWSLEQLQPDLSCSLANNWQSSDNPKGASPGEENSQSGGFSMKKWSKLERAFLIADTGLYLQFSSSVGSLQPEHLELEPKLKVTGLWPVSEDFKHWQGTIEANGKTPLQLTLRGPLTDCAGRPVRQDEATPLIPLRAARTRELRLSEVMYDPGPEGTEYIELHNLSPNWLLADGWGLRRGQQECIFPAFSLLPPSGYVAYASEPAKSPFARKLQPLAIPSLPNAGDTLQLLNADGEPEEMLMYTDELHHLLLSQSQGTALERLCFALPAHQPENWSSSASGGTPGRANSQSCPDALSETVRFWADPNLVFPEKGTFTPEAELRYRLQQLPASGNLRIYTTEGVLVRELLNNALLASEGKISWNGRDQHGSALALGYYIAVLRITYADGKGELLRCSVVVGERLD